MEYMHVAVIWRWSSHIMLADTMEENEHCLVRPSLSLSFVVLC